MSVLCSIMALVMTWTVETKSSVSGDASLLPAGAEVAYRCTYQKGDVRAGDTATLSISRLGAVRIDSIEVYMRSNKTAGAGELSVWINGEQTVVRTGTYKEWTTVYDNQTSRPVPGLDHPVTGVDDLKVQLVGTTNSLHIDRYVIYVASGPVHSVQLMNGTESVTTLTEQHSGQGVVLPSMEDMENWHFVGWTESEFWVAQEIPSLYEAQDVFYPEQNTTLWATYYYADPMDSTYMTEVESGRYLYMNSATGMALAGVPESGIMQYKPVNLLDADQWYEIEFVGTETAYITHMPTGTPIGYTSGATMEVDASPWSVYHDGEETLFYTVINRKKYVLWLNITHKDYNDFFYAGLFPAEVLSSPMRLMKTSQVEEPLFTCHPEMKQELEQPQTPTKEYRIRFGNYELRIINGHKQIIVQ